MELMSLFGWGGSNNLLVWRALRTSAFISLIVPLPPPRSSRAWRHGQLLRPL